MKSLFKCAKVYQNAEFSSRPLSVEDGIIVSRDTENAEAVDFGNCYIFPGFADVHVHL